MFRGHYFLCILILFSCKIRPIRLADKSFGGEWSVAGKYNASRADAGDSAACFINKRIIASAVTKDLGDTLPNNANNSATYTTKIFAKDLKNNVHVFVHKSPIKRSVAPEPNKPLFLAQVAFVSALMAAGLYVVYALYTGFWITSFFNLFLLLASGTPVLGLAAAILLIALLAFILATIAKRRMRKNHNFQGKALALSAQLIFWTLCILLFAYVIVFIGILITMI